MHVQWVTCKLVTCKLETGKKSKLWLKVLHVSNFKWRAPPHSPVPSLLSSPASPPPAATNGKDRPVPEPAGRLTHLIDPLKHHCLAPDGSYISKSAHADLQLVIPTRIRRQIFPQVTHLQEYQGVDPHFDTIARQYHDIVKTLEGMQWTIHQVEMDLRCSHEDPNT